MIKNNDFINFSFKITAAHTISYFIAGIFALLVLRYDKIFNIGVLSFMRPTSSVWVAAGPALQIIRGILLAIVLFSFRSIFENTKYGWIKFWLINFGLCYILTLSPAVGSFEGFIYTNIPLKFHLIGLPEILIYTILFSGLMFFLNKKFNKTKIIISIILVLIIVLFSIMGVLAVINS